MGERALSEEGFGGEYGAEARFAAELAREAGAIALARRSGAVAREKSNRSFVTDLDVELEEFIRERLSRAFPDDRLTGEESADGGGDGPRRWCIDPIDGTGNYVHDLPIWAISLGLLDRGEPVAGAIAIPPLGEVYHATRGGGAWRNGERLGRLSDATEFHPQDNVSLSTNALRTLDPRSAPGRLRDLGSACCEMAFLASGRLKLSIFQGEHAHDVAAGTVLLSETGCAFRRFDGEWLTAREFVARTPVPSPTLLGTPGRLEALAGRLRRLV